jgi:catechol 2,3-dioxygenase-like lactoylglutathione lyase family enzyme
LLGLELGHVAFECRDIAGDGTFYASLLGLRRVREAKTGDGRDFFVLGRDKLRVELFPEGPRGRRVCALRGLGGSLDNVIAMLQSRNVPIDRVIDYSTVDRAFKVCFITDPRGMRSSSWKGTPTMRGTGGRRERRIPLQELTAASVREIESLFADVFTNEPWNDVGRTQAA